MIPPNLLILVNHLWQSTLCVAGTWLLTLALRKNRAAVRYGLWLAASAKFLIPFSLLVDIGSHFAWRTAPAIRQPHFRFVVEELGRPFHSPASVPLPAAAPPASSPIPAILFGVWLCGLVVSAVSWLRWWQYINAAQRAATPLRLNSSIPVMSSSARLEPGVFGIRKPVLLLPEGITDRLTPAQLEAILAHELCHVRRRDNLTAAIQMMVEAVFWFYPVVWWIRARLVEERERACDEEVLSVTRDPHVYAEAILNVCRFYLASPLVCVSGVTGSNLKRRIEEIMRGHIARKLNSGRKLLLISAATLVVAGPVLVGIVVAPRLRGQSQQASEHLAFEVASVKPNNSSDYRNSQLQFLPGARLVIRNIPVQLIIATAYNLPFQSPRLAVGPEWQRVAGERYDIEAIADKSVLTQDLSTKVREDKLKLMLQSLLQDRFKLSLRSQPKEQAVYALVIAKGGPKLQISKRQEKDCVEGPIGSQMGCHNINGGQGRGIHGDSVDIADVALFVQNWTDRPVVDKTGLTDLYNIQTDGWLPMRPRPPNPDGTPQTAESGLYDPDRQTLADVFRQLGLRMESQRAVVDMFVVEHLERPSVN